MRSILLSTVATAMPVAFMSDTCETVDIKGSDGKALRVNKSEYEADQASDKPTMELFTAGENQQSVPDGAFLPPPEGVIVPPAPSAPDFKGLNGQVDGTSAAVMPTDPATGAAIPTIPSPGQLLVSSEGTGAKKKFFVVDATGAKVTDKSEIDKDGYKTDKDAYDAILKLPH